jgi:hypothetical protein
VKTGRQRSRVFDPREDAQGAPLARTDNDTAKQPGKRQGKLIGATQLRLVRPERRSCAAAPLTPEEDSVIAPDEEDEEIDDLLPADLWFAHPPSGKRQLVWSALIRAPRLVRRRGRGPHDQRNRSFSEPIWEQGGRLRDPRDDSRRFF